MLRSSAAIGSALFSLHGNQAPQRSQTRWSQCFACTQGRTKHIERNIPMYGVWKWHLKESMLPCAWENWKLVATSDLSEIELYNLARDPQETTDLRAKWNRTISRARSAAKPLHAEIEAEGPDWWKRLDVIWRRPRQEKDKKKAS